MRCDPAQGAGRGEGWGCRDWGRRPRLTRAPLRVRARGKPPARALGRPLEGGGPLCPARGPPSSPVSKQRMVCAVSGVCGSAPRKTRKGRPCSGLRGEHFHSVVVLSCAYRTFTLTGRHHLSGFGPPLPTVSGSGPAGTVTGEARGARVCTDEGSGEDRGGGRGWWRARHLTRRAPGLLSVTPLVQTPAQAGGRQRQFSYRAVL